jgi:hypothetical protein
MIITIQYTEINFFALNIFFFNIFPLAFQASFLTYKTYNLQNTTLICYFSWKVKISVLVLWLQINVVGKNAFT